MKIEVTLKRIIYQSKHHYVVFLGTLVGQSKDVFCVGNAMSLQKDTVYACSGEYVEHATYGMQFAFTDIEVSQHRNRTQITHVLRHSSKKKLTHKEIHTLIETYGIDILNLLKTHLDINDPLYEPLSKKIKKKLAEVLVTMSETVVQESINEVLMLCGFSSIMIGNINATLKQDVYQTIANDPYELILIDGIGFKSAQKVAQWFNISNDDIRCESAIIYDLVSTMTFARGDTFISEEEVALRFNQLHLKHSFSTCCAYAQQKKYIVVEAAKVYAYHTYSAEKVIADFLKYNTPQPLRLANVSALCETIEAKIGFRLDASQQDAISSFASQGHMILTGGPGTGKTTIVKAILQMIATSDNNKVIQCCAPTGRAAKRLSQLTSHPATTLHSLLQWNKDSNTFARNEHNPIVVDILIIDEMSMIDVVLFANTLRACPPHVKLLLIGDTNQLPSVAPGNVLLDLINAKVMHCVVLNVVYRQKGESDILRLAYAVLNNTWLFDVKHDVLCIESSPKHVKDHVLTLIQKALAKGYRIEDIQVLSPMYKGVAGVDALNHICQKVFNPPNAKKQEIAINAKIFRVFDKVMQLKNRPDDHVYNGDIGILVEVIHPHESENNQLTLVVDYDGHFVEYQGDYIHQLTHAYALSVHKAQGSEYPIVILIAVNEYNHMLQSRLYYTGITRAANSLVCVGETQAFVKAAQQESTITRQSTLKERLMLEKAD